MLTILQGQDIFALLNDPSLIERINSCNTLIKKSEVKIRRAVARIESRIGCALDQLFEKWTPVSIVDLPSVTLTAIEKIIGLLPSDYSGERVRQALDDGLNGPIQDRLPKRGTILRGTKPTPSNLATLYRRLAAQPSRQSSPTTSRSGDSIAQDPVPNPSSPGRQRSPSSQRNLSNPSTPTPPAHPPSYKQPPLTTTAILGKRRRARGTASAENHRDQDLASSHVPNQSNLGRKLLDLCDPASGVEHSSPPTPERGRGAGKPLDEVYGFTSSPTHRAITDENSLGLPRDSTGGDYLNYFDDDSPAALDQDHTNIYSLTSSQPARKDGRDELLANTDSFVVMTSTIDHDTERIRNSLPSATPLLNHLKSTLKEAERRHGQIQSQINAVKTRWKAIQGEVTERKSRYAAALLAKNPSLEDDDLDASDKVLEVMRMDKVREDEYEKGRTAHAESEGRRTAALGTLADATAMLARNQKVLDRLQESIVALTDEQPNA